MENKNIHVKKVPCEPLTVYSEPDSPILTRSLPSISGITLESILDLFSYYEEQTGRYPTEFYLSMESWEQILLSIPDGMLKDSDDPPPVNLDGKFVGIINGVNVYVGE